MKDNALYGTIKVNEIGEEIHSGVLKDEEVILRVNYPDNANKRIKLRRIEFYDREHKQHYVFLSNLFEMRADLIAALYKLRWQIELLFNQLKQNFPLKYFLGDNENAIRIQIYCALIANLIMTVIQKNWKAKGNGLFQIWLALPKSIFSIISISLDFWKIRRKTGKKLFQIVTS